MPHVRTLRTLALAAFLGWALSSSVAPAAAQDAPKPPAGKSGEGDKDAKKAPRKGEPDPARREALKKRMEEARLARILREHPEADKDKDGKISKEEADEFEAKSREQLLKEHPEADKDKDGKISPQEMLAWTRLHPPMPTAKQLEEILKRHPEIDKNKDGTVSQEELADYRRQNQKREGATGSAEKKRRRPGGGDEKPEGDGKTPEKKSV